MHVRVPPVIDFNRPGMGNRRGMAGLGICGDTFADGTTDTSGCGAGGTDPTTGLPVTIPEYGGGGGGTNWSALLAPLIQAGASLTSQALAQGNPPGTCLLRNANGSCAVVSTGTAVSPSISALPTVAQTAAIGSSTALMVGAGLLVVFLLMKK